MKSFANSAWVEGPFGSHHSTTQLTMPKIPRRAVRKEIEGSQRPSWAPWSRIDLRSQINLIALLT